MRSRRDGGGQLMFHARHARVVQIHRRADFFAIQINIERAVIACPREAEPQTGGRFGGGPFHLQLAIGSFIAPKQLRIPAPLIAKAFHVLSARRILGRMGHLHLSRRFCFQPTPHCLAYRLAWRGKEPVPAFAFLRVDVRTLGDGLAELEERLHQQRRNRQVIRAVIEPMLRAFVLRKGRYAAEPFRPLIVDILAERPTRHAHFVRHLFGGRIKVLTTPSHQPLVHLENIAVQLQQIHHRVVVLKPVHPSHRRCQKRLLLRRRT